MTYEEEGIVLLEGLGVGGRDAGVLWRSVHLVENILRKSLLDLEDVGAATSFLDDVSWLVSTH